MFELDIEMLKEQGLQLVDSAKKTAILDCLNTIYRCIDANDRDRSRIHALSLQRLYRTKCHRIVVRDDAVKFGVAQQRRNHVHCVCTVIICNQRSRRLRCLDAIVLQCLQYGSGALFSMYDFCFVSSYSASHLLSQVIPPPTPYIALFPCI